jgi:hypothetical protein
MKKSNNLISNKIRTISNFVSMKNIAITPPDDEENKEDDVLILISREKNV